MICLWSWSLKNEGALAYEGLYHHLKKACTLFSTKINYFIRILLEKVTGPLIEEIPSTLCGPKIYYGVQKNPSYKTIRLNSKAFVVHCRQTDLYTPVFHIPVYDRV
jgi:hypothetical protein